MAPTLIPSKRLGPWEDQTYQNFHYLLSEGKLEKYEMWFLPIQYYKL